MGPKNKTYISERNANYDHKKKHEYDHFSMSLKRQKFVNKTAFLTNMEKKEKRLRQQEN